MSTNTDRPDHEPDNRFTVPIHSVSFAARWVGMPVATFKRWANDGHITVLPRQPGTWKRVPFIGLAEATIIQAFRVTQLAPTVDADLLTPRVLKRVMRELAEQISLPHPLATRELCEIGAEIVSTLWDCGYRPLPIRGHIKPMFLSPIRHKYLDRVTYGNKWASSLTSPATREPVMRIIPDVASGQPLLIRGGGHVPTVLSRLKAGEPLASIARDYDATISDIQQATRALTGRTHG